MNVVSLLLSSLLALFLLGTGCVKLESPPPAIDFYTLEYDPPQTQDMPPLPVVLEIERFGIVPDYNTTRMVFKKAPFERDEYVYHRWHAEPSDVITSFLRRDCTRSGRFLAISGPTTGIPPTHILSGSVGAFYEQDHPDRWEAVLEVTITLCKANEPEVSRRVLFQRSYTKVTTCAARTPSGVAQAMSLAMQDISGQIRRDVATALTQP